jgi:hypothetical protein
LDQNKPTGPPADRLKLKGDWKQLIKGALEKRRPSGGWPKPKQKKGSVP